MIFDYLIVGAGFAGSVLAERLASECNKRILLIDRRSHFGGNAYDSRNEAGILIHHYGPHLFHTNDAGVLSYLSRFTDWIPYSHRVLANVRGVLHQIPINRNTLNGFFDVRLATEKEAEDFLARKRIPHASITNSEEIITSHVGEELFEAFFRGYTKKQWMQEPRRLSPGVCGRLPVRMNTDDRYFQDRYQFMPASGYTELFRKMLSHPNITFAADTDFRSVNRNEYKRLIYTGPIDEFYDYTHGKLPYRSLRFEHRTVEGECLQPVAQINYCDEDVPYTRSCEWKHCTGQKHAFTCITREYPSATGEPLYPVPSDENHAMYELYRKENIGLPDVLFAGRLAEYRYYNMDQVVSRTLRLFESIKNM